MKKFFPSAIFCTLLLIFSSNIFSQAIVETIQLDGAYSMDCLTLGNDGVLYGTEGFDGNRVYKIGLDGTVTIFASGLSGPIDIDFDNPGNMYVSTFNNMGLYKITPQGQSSRFATVNVGPSGVVLNRSTEKVYVSHYGAGFPGNGNSIYVVDSSGNASIFMQGNGLAAPVSLTIDENGNIYAPNIADAKLFKITPNGDISLLCELPAPGNLHPFHVGHIEYSQGYLYVTGNTGSPYVFKVSLTGEYVIFAGSGIVGHQDGPAMDAQFSGPNGITVSVTGDTLFISELTSPTTLRMIKGVTTVGISTVSTVVPERYSLHQNYPNPFNPETKIRFDLPQSAGSNSIVRLAVYDSAGKEVAVLVNRELQPGTYEYNWNAGSYGGGVYFYKLQSGEFSETKKMVLVK